MKKIAKAVLNYVLFHKYYLKSKAEMRKVFNTVIVKGFQQDEAKIDSPDYIENRTDYLTKIFEKFGEILSVFVMKVNSTRNNAPKRLLAFVCFANPDTAAKAVLEMNEKEFDEKKLYVA